MSNSALQFPRISRDSNAQIQKSQHDLLPWRVFPGVISVLAGTDILSVASVTGALLITAAIMISGLADTFG